MMESPEWKQGQWGERQVRRKFENDGWWVVPVHLIENEGAPGLTRRLQKLVLPDLQVARDGGIRWVEVKTKGRCPYSTELHRFQHGISLHNWRNYRQVCFETGADGYLAIVQMDIQKLLLGSFSWIAIDAQEKYDDGTLRSYGEPMIFLAANRFDRLDMDGSYEPSMHLDDPPPVPIPPKVVRPWEQNRKFGPKQEMFPW